LHIVDLFYKFIHYVYVPILFYMVRIIYLLLFFIPGGVYAQAVIVDWQQCYGGSEYDRGYSIIRDTAGLTLLCGSDSYDGQVPPYYANSNFWLIRTDMAGNIRWSKTYGGSDDDVPERIFSIPGEGYLMAGYTQSINGNVHGNHGLSEYWIIKTDTSGSIQWQKCLGGSTLDFLHAADITADSGYILMGYTDSHDGDVTGFHGFYDYWAVKVDKEGNIKWAKCYGGSMCELGLGVTSTSDGGAVLAGNTDSQDGDVQSEYHGGIGDAWIVKVDSMGNIEWERCFGGSVMDNVSAVLPLKDGGYLCAGNTNSNDGQVSGNHGGFDYWIFKTDHFGNLVWQKCYGGSMDDIPLVLKPSSDGNFYITGYTVSNDGDVSGNHGLGIYQDIWIIKIDSVGTLLWQQCLGGDASEIADDMIEFPKGHLMFLGATGTINNTGDVDCTFHGAGDVWLISGTDSTLTAIDETKRLDFSIRVYPNPSNREFIFEYALQDISSSTEIIIFNKLGIILDRIPIQQLTGKLEWIPNNLPSDLYYYRLVNGKTEKSGKIIIGK